MFRMSYTGGVHTPVIVCDVCKRRILKADDGIILYGYNAGEGLPWLDDERDRQIVVHKMSSRHHCLLQVDDDYVFSHELETVLVWLEQNLKFEEARKSAEFKAEMLSRL